MAAHPRDQPRPHERDDPPAVELDSNGSEPSDEDLTGASDDVDEETEHRGPPVAPDERPED